MTARGGERSERTHRAAAWQHDALRRVPRQAKAPWLHRANAACYNLATETTRKNEPAHLLPRCSSRPLFFLNGALPVVCWRRRSSSGDARETRAARNFALFPAPAFSFPSPIALAATARRTAVTSTAIFIWFPEAFVFRPAPRLARRSRPASVSRFIRLFVRPQHYDVFRASAIFEDGMETDGKHCRRTRARGGVAS